ncbi:hypothetical protein [Dokdonella soli]|uniref:Uncharacterized protein n=1 Tax=Dokdonella soli TaxID=529810 RepID=A0ABN1IUR9_9GAMM
MTDVPSPADRSKLAVALLVILSATGLLWAHRLDGAQWVSAVTWTVAAYMVGQVGAVLAAGWVVQTAAKAKVP